MSQDNIVLIYYLVKLSFVYIFVLNVQIERFDRNVSKLKQKCLLLKQPPP